MSEERKRPGRPSIDPDGKASIQVSLRLSRKMYAQVAEKARSMGVGAVCYIRSLVNDLDGLYAPSDQPIPISHRAHIYVGGLPPTRLRRMQYGHECRARKLGIDYDLIDLRLVYAKADGICGICLMPVGYEEFTVDHIRPVSKGGSHVLSNLQPAHPSCNSTKGAKWPKTN